MLSTIAERCFEFCATGGPTTSVDLSSLSDASTVETELQSDGVVVADDDVTAFTVPEPTCSHATCWDTLATCVNASLSSSRLLSLASPSARHLAATSYQLSSLLPDPSAATAATCTCLAAYRECMTGCPLSRYLNVRRQCPDQCSAECSLESVDIPADQDCVLGTKWIASKCSRSCGAGFIRYTRQITQLPRGSGTTCASFGDEFVRYASCSGDKCGDECYDMLLNNDETDVDCGGPSCNKCGEGKACTLDRDCAQGLKCVEPGDVAKQLGASQPICLSETLQDVVTEPDRAVIQGSVSLVGGLAADFKASSFKKAVARATQLVGADDVVVVNIKEDQLSSGEVVLRITYLIDLGVAVDDTGSSTGSARRLLGTTNLVDEMVAWFEQNKFAMDAAVYTELSWQMPTLSSVDAGTSFGLSGTAENEANGVQDEVDQVAVIPESETNPLEGIGSGITGGGGGDTAGGDTSGGDSSGSDSSGGNNPGAGSSGGAPSDDSSDLPEWVVPVAAVAGILFVGGVILIIVLIRKKQNKRSKLVHVTDI